MKKIYISGPMSGLPDFNFQKFEKAGKYLTKKYPERIIINPHKIHRNNRKDLQYSYYMRNDIKALCDCDSIYMLENWNLSPGAKLEYAIATALKLEIFYKEDKMTEKKLPKKDDKKKPSKKPAKKQK